MAFDKLSEKYTAFVPRTINRAIPIISFAQFSIVCLVFTLRWMILQIRSM
jgi:hypothetical protein